MVQKITLADCKRGDIVTLKSIEEHQLSIQLISMGCLIGEQLTIERIAPFGDPLIISIEDSFFSLRRDDAKKMEVSKD